jgi:hypothetical protein
VWLAKKGERLTTLQIFYHLERWYMLLNIVNIKPTAAKVDAEDISQKMDEHQTESKLSFERSLVNLTRLRFSPDQRRRDGVIAFKIKSFLFRSRLVWPSICLQR